MTGRNDPEAFRQQALTMMKAKAGWMLALGVLLLALGVAAAVLPHIATLVVEVAIAYLLLLAGIATLLKAFRGSDGRNRFMELLMGVLYIAVGVLLLMQPAQGVAALTLILAAYFFIDGGLRLVLAFTAAEAPGRVWQVLGALASIALGAIIVAGYPFDSAWILGLLVGINLAFAGIGMIGVSLKLKQL
ncbi:MAG: HdeD family acid-resistance protein [Rhodospirillales bacterium]